MKLQCGLLYVDGRAARLPEAARVLGEFAAVPAETRGEFADGPLIMAYRGDRITWEEESEIQPFKHGPYVITWDGRLDNREDVAARVGLTPMQSLPDPVLVANAYAGIGDSIFNDLIGEFAFTLWCRRSRSLLFCRSACGARPLYYLPGKHALLWSSSFAHLARISDVELTPNESYLLNYLLARPLPQQTPFLQIQAVQPNTVLRFHDGGVRACRELWSPSTVRPLTDRSDQEHEEHCREILTQAVRVRLRSRHPLFAELSGGFDSSSVVLLADQLLRAAHEPPERLRTVSYVYEQSESCDESFFIRSVEEHRGIPGIRISEQEQQITLGLRDIEFTGVPNPLHCFPGKHRALAKHLCKHQARVVLTGSGGDGLFCSEPDGAALVADELLQGNIREMHRQCRTWSRATANTYFSLLLKRALPLAVSSILRLAPGGQNAPPPEWLHPRCKKNIRDDSWQIGPPGTRRTPGFAAKLNLIHLALSHLSSGYFGEYGAVFVTHPYLHRPLIEFCLAVPLNQLVRNGQGEISDATSPS